MVTAAVNAPALRFYGSKWNMGRFIIGHFPEHECYAEPFGGGAAVLLQKARSWLEVLNDRDGNIVNFFQVLRDRPSDLVRAIELTPYAKTEWELSYQDCDDPLERARRFYVRAYQNIAGATGQWRSGWRRQKVISHDRGGKKKMTPAPISFMRTAHLYQVADRLRGVQIECDDALAVIARYDTPATLFYLDPPYPAQTRGRWKSHGYQFEMSNEDHLELARVAHRVKGMVIISGYRCELYDSAYSDWQRVDKRVRVNGAGSAIESLWLSANVRIRQMSLLTQEVSDVE